MDRNLTFGGREIEPDIRMLYDMKEVIYDKEWLQKAENVPLYFMYRDLYRKGDREKIKNRNLRYDITVIPSRKLGKEYVKTKGHYHPTVNEMTYPEMYGVLEGKAHYLLQKGRQDVKRTVLVKAEKGDKVIIPPGYGHITINPYSNDLKMANWVCRDFSSIYGPIVEKGGGAWFELDEGLKRNPNYNSVPELEIFEASKNDPFEKEIYSLINKPDELDFLTSPEQNKEIFEGLGFF